MPTMPKQTQLKQQLIPIINDPKKLEKFPMKH